MLVSLVIVVGLCGRDSLAQEATASSGATETSTTQPSPTQATKTAAVNEVPTEHPLLPAINIAQKSLEAMQTINDYEATFVKQERVGGQLVKQSMQMRFRERPFSVYLHYGEELAGREILYVQGKNGNQLLAHEGSGLKSLIGTVSLAVTSAEAMQENRYPITMIGMRKMLETVLDQWQEETKYGEVSVKYYPQAKLGGRPCKVIESTHPQPRRQFKFHKTRLFLDRETELPVRVEQYGFPAMPGAKPPLEEEYTYSNIRTNTGLTDRDFSTANPRYSF